MTRQRLPHPYVPLIAFALTSLAACGQAPPSAAPDRQTAAPPTAAQPIDAYQALAFNAGRDLIGTRAPSLSFTTLDGTTIKLGEARLARPLYLKFWATWCVTCREQMDGFKADFARYGGDIEVVAVNTGVNDDRTAVEAYGREVQLAMPITIDDGRLAQALHLRVTPQHVIIGRDGTIRYIGHLEDSRLQAELLAAIADRPAGPTPPSPIRPPARAAALTAVQGVPVRIDGPSRGATRLIYFLSPWCETYLKDTRPAVAQECKTTREALSRVSSQGGAEVIGIASGLSTDADGVRLYLHRTGLRAPIVLDENGELFRRFGVQSFPSVIRLDAAGHSAGRMSVRDIDALARNYIF